MQKKMMNIQKWNYNHKNENGYNMKNSTVNIRLINIEDIAVNAIVNV